MDERQGPRMFAIEKRFVALGWGWGNTHQALYDLAIASFVPPFIRGDRNPAFTEKFYQIAERLLALYEPGPVVRVGKREIATEILTEGLKPGKYKLVRWDDV